MSDATTSLIILAVTVVLFVWNRLPVGVVAIGSAIALYLCGLISVDSMTSGLGATVIVFIAALFVVSEALEASGITGWIGRSVGRLAGTGRARAVLAIMTLAAVLSALITVNGAAAALVPVTVAIARHAGLVPSRVLIPLAYACSAGALLTLSGSPVNVIVNDAAVEQTGSGFGYFSFALVGLPLVLVTAGVSILFGDRLLPHRESTTLPRDFSNYLGTVVDHYGLDRRIYRLHVGPGSAAVAATPAGLMTAPGDPPAGESGVVLVATERPGARIVDDDTPLDVGDVLVISGAGETVEQLARDHGLTLEDVAGRRSRQGSLIGRDVGICELVVPPRSDWVGTSAFPGMIREDGLLVLSIRRRNRDVGPRAITLEEGDMVLVHGSWGAIDALADDQRVLVVDSSEQVRRQTGRLGRTAPRAGVVLVAMIVLLATGVVPPVVAGLLAALAMVLSGVINSEQAYRAVSWPTLVLIAALIPMSTAISTSGGAEMIARPIVDLVSGHSPYVLLIALFLLTTVVGQFISNAATVLIVIPIAMAAAADVGVDARPVLMLVCVAGAASLLTPIATPANMIVMNPGGYRFGDYWRLGLLTTACWLVIAVALIPVFWPLNG
ncbi:SLC13 family permease [Gordonia sp. 'Campus']|uniref:SLC13 family permease n=1 Tax=Gordonia sp. 'Campus' TaxID=2915824 RepID=UPI001EE3E7CD|nr:SLC13 family permease [Gordonia sp. 'Campus']